MEEYLRKIVQLGLGSAPEEMLKTSLEVCVEILGGSGGSILGEEGPYLQFLFSDVPELIGVRVPFNSIAGATVERNLVIYTHAPSDKRHFGGVDKQIKNVTKYLLSAPIPSVHQRPGVMAKNAGALQVLFDTDAFPELGIGDQPLEFDLADFKSGSLCCARLSQMFWILPLVAFSMEVMKLRQTSYQAIHELKNKMISALSWVGALKEDIGALAPEALADADVTEDFELADTSIREGAELAKTYLQFTKLYTPEFATANLNATLSEVAASLKALSRELGAEGLEVDLRLDADIAPRELDAAKLKMAFFNLGKNAVEAMASFHTPSPTLTLVSERDGDGVKITLADNGPGMPKEIADSLFIPFKTKKEGGTGLGLTITKKIVDLHGGSIRVETGPEGTKFVVKL